MKSYDRTWPTSLLAIALGSLAGWSVWGSSITVGSDHHHVYSAPTLYTASTTAVEVESAAEPVERLAPMPLEVTVARSTDIEFLLEQLRRGANPADRRMAAVILGAHPEPDRVSGALMIALRSDDVAAVRSTAAASLRRLRYEEAFGSLALAATLDQDLRVREAAVAALGEVGGTQAIAILVDILRVDPSAEVRKQAVEALGEIGDSSSLAQLGQVLADDESSIVREAAFHHLKQARDRGR